MSIFPRSTWWWSSLATLCLASFTLALGLQGPASKKGEKGGALPAFLDEFQGSGLDKARVLPLFLDDFRADLEPPLASKEVRFPSAVGEVVGLWARPEVKQPLPAVLIVYDEESWTDWMKANTRHLASIGYEALAVNVHRHRVAAARLASPAGRGVGGERPAFTDEATLAELSAAVRWLRSRSAVLPNRLGVVGWGWSGGQALALASATSLQACVICDAPLPSEPGLVIGLRETPVLGVFAGEDLASRKLPAFRKLLARLVKILSRARKQGANGASACLSAKISADRLRHTRQCGGEQGGPFGASVAVQRLFGKRDLEVRRLVDDNT
jgi:dienelactone hydrolase